MSAPGISGHARILPVIRHSRPPRWARFAAAKCNFSVVAADVDLPGYRFHPLKGERRGEFAVSVSGNWRLTFRFEGQDAVAVTLEDCH